MSAINTAVTIARLARDNIKYFPEPETGNDGNTDRTQDIAYAYSIPACVGRFRLIPAGLCTNWYSSPLQWMQIATSHDLTTFNNRLGDLFNSLEDGGVSAKLVISSWAWNRDTFEGPLAIGSLLDAALDIDDIDEAKGTTIATFTHGYLRCLVSDKILWATSGSLSIFQPRQITRNYNPQSKATKYTNPLKHLESTKAWPGFIASFLKDYKQYRAETSNTERDVFLVSDDGDSSLGLFKFVERMTRERNVTTVLNKLGMAAVGLMGLLESSKRCTEVIDGQPIMTKKRFDVYDCLLESSAISKRAKDVIKKIPKDDRADADMLRTIYFAAAISPVCLFSELPTNTTWQGGRARLSSLLQVSCASAVPLTPNLLALESSIWDVIIQTALHGPSALGKLLDERADSWLALSDENSAFEPIARATMQWDRRYCILTREMSLDPNAVVKLGTDFCDFVRKNGGKEGDLGFVSRIADSVSTSIAEVNQLQTSADVSAEVVKGGANATEPTESGIQRSQEAEIDSTTTTTATATNSAVSHETPDCGVMGNDDIGASTENESARNGLYTLYVSINDEADVLHYKVAILQHVTEEGQTGGFGDNHCGKVTGEVSQPMVTLADVQSGQDATSPRNCLHTGYGDMVKSGVGGYPSIGNIPVSTSENQVAIGVITPVGGVCATLNEAGDTSAALDDESRVPTEAMKRTDNRSPTNDEDEPNNEGIDVDIDKLSELTDLDEQQAPEDEDTDMSRPLTEGTGDDENTDGNGTKKRHIESDVEQSLNKKPRLVRYSFPRNAKKRSRRVSVGRDDAVSSAIVEQLQGDEDKVRTSSRAAAQMTLDEDGIEEISPALFAHIGFNRKSNALKLVEKKVLRSHMSSWNTDGTFVMKHLQTTLPVWENLESDFALAETIQGQCPIALPGSMDWFGDGTGYPNTTASMTLEQYRLSASPHVNNAVLEFQHSHWKSLSRAERESIFKDFSVVVRSPHPVGHELSWDAPEIRDCFDFHIERQAHEVTKVSTSSPETNSRIVRATLSDLVANIGENPHAVLNFLSIPHSTDRISDLNTQHLSVRHLDSIVSSTHSVSRFGVWRTTPDFGSLNWSLAANTSAFSEPHSDAAGFCTYVNIILGSKIWYIAPGKLCPDADGWDNSVLNHKWIPVHLRKGDQLIMRPGTVHAVMTSEHCLATGGHFYSNCVMFETLRSLVIEHYYGHLTTNTEHDTAIFYLFKIVSSLVDLFTSPVLTDEQRRERLPDDGNLASLFVAVDNANELEARFYNDSPVTTKWRSTKEFKADFRNSKKLLEQLLQYVRSEAFELAYVGIISSMKTLIQSLEAGLLDETGVREDGVQQIRLIERSFE